jgi:hypothetical protein
MIWLLPLPVSKFDWRHTGRRRKRDNLLTGDGDVGQEPILQRRESLVLYKSFNTLRVGAREIEPMPTKAKKWPALLILIPQIRNSGKRLRVQEDLYHVTQQAFMEGQQIQDIFLSA